MKETREQYQARKQAQREKHLAWQKRVQERAAKRKAEAMEQATAEYNQNRHISGADLAAMKSFDLVNKWFATPDCRDREVLYAEIMRRAKKRAKKIGSEFSVTGLDKLDAINVARKLLFEQAQ